jgi:TetR/AcrR family transcriptional regulator, copper-responsive repressor
MAGGRQREFDKTDALDKAMRVFWKKGYVGASLTDLTEAMGINKPSMYATFGNKEQLFIQSTDYYLEHFSKVHAHHLSGDKPLKERVKSFLLSIIKTQSCPDNPKGCYVSLCISEAEGDQYPKDATKIIHQIRDSLETNLTGFFKQAIANKELTKAAKPEALASYFATLLHGTAAMARGGKTGKQLSDIVETAVGLLD